MREYTIEIFDKNNDEWYSMDSPTSDVVEAMARLEYYVSFGRKARVTGVNDVEYS